MPKRIPIAEARRVAEAQNLRQVVLLGFDGERTHVVTYGVTKADCDQAAIAQKWWNGKTGPEMEAARKATEAEIARLTAQRAATQAALEEARKDFTKRRDGQKEWLRDNSPFCATDQKHLDEGTPERAYWHYGYMVALGDVLNRLARALTPTPRE